MKFSKYNVLVKHDDNFIIFNTITRKYVFFNKGKYKVINDINKKLNKEKYSIDECNIIKKMWKMGGIVDDSLDEYEKINYNENNLKFQNDVFFITIQPTLDCNFRCVYCYEEHKKRYMDKLTQEKVISFIKNIATKVSKIFIIWFGGEPLLAADTINKMSQKFIKLCSNSACEYGSMMVTNGYLISENNINILRNCRIDTIQITLDGDKEYHNIKRPLLNGEGTFDRIFTNIIMLLKYNFKLILRFNVDKDNVNNISEVFDLIDKKYRRNITISICNLFQSKNKIDLYELYLAALKSGYNIEVLPNKKYRCDGYSKNSITIQPNGKIAPCSILAEKGIYFGGINEDGNLNIDNKNMYYAFKNYVVTNQSKCSKCIKEPLCGGPCMYKNIVKGNICDEKHLNGLSLEEQIKLKFEKDLLNKKIEVLKL